MCQVKLSDPIGVINSMKVPAGDTEDVLTSGAQRYYIMFAEMSSQPFPSYFWSTEQGCVLFPPRNSGGAL